MTDNLRDTKFLGFAKLQLPELDSLFASLYQAYVAGNIPLRDAYIQRIETYLAQRAYDLIYSSLDIESIRLLDMTPEEVIQKHISDLTQWPESSTE